jgi:hypothetical protein
MRLDALDRTAIYYTLYGARSFNITASPYTVIDTVWGFIQIPLRRSTYFSEWCEGGLYSSYLAVYNPSLCSKMNDKKYWAEVFAKHSIHHPLLYVSNRSGTRKIHRPLVKNQTYIQKPINGALGFGVKRVSADEALHNPTNTIVQQMLNSCSEKKTRHFRFVTLYDGTPFYLFELSSNNVLSNLAGGGTLTWCHGLKCNHINSFEQESLKDMMTQLSHLHMRIFGEVFSIGWDVMLHCEQLVVSSYVLEGNILHGTWGYPGYVDLNVVSDYKERCTYFLKGKGYL